jgi:Xaa-Pro aminopeptidase
MVTMQPALKNGRNVWDHVNMPEKEFEARVERVRAQMKKGGIDLLILYGRGLTEYADPCYVSNFIIRLPRGTIALVPASGSVVLFFEGAARGLPSLLVTTCVKELKPTGNVAKECAKYLKEKALVPCTVGLGRIEEQMPYQEFRALKEALTDCKIVDAGNIVPNLRMIKSEKESDEIRRAGRIVKRCFDQVISVCSTGMSEQFLEAMLRKQARLDGAEDCRVLFSMSNEKQSFRPAENKRIEPGTVFILYFALAFERYWAEGVRTFAAGESSFSEVLSDITAIYDRALNTLKPGMKVSQLCKELLDAARGSSLEPLSEFDYGNGIGLSLNELPVINEKSAQKIKEGMCIAVRLPVTDKTYGKVIFGRTFLVGKNGAEAAT